MDDEQVPKHRTRKGECGCVAHAEGVCADCGHLLFVHGKNGCMYSVTRFDGSQTCVCPQARTCNHPRIP
jgi:hypothetical protein